MTAKENGAVAPTPKKDREKSFKAIIQNEEQKDIVLCFESAFAEEAEHLLAALDEADAAIRAEMEKPHLLEVMRAFTDEMADFPFAHDLEVSEVLYRGIGHASEDTLDQADKETNGGARRYRSFCFDLRSHYFDLMVDLEFVAEENPALFDQAGLRLDSFGHIDLESIGATLKCEKKDGLPLGSVRDTSVKPGNIYPYQGVRHPQDLFNIIREVCKNKALSRWAPYLLGYSDKPLQDDTEPENVALIDYAITKRAVDHSFANKKGFSALIDIAYSEDGRQTLTARKGKSAESVTVSAPPALARDFIQYEMANARYLSVVLNTIYRITREPAFRGKSYFYKGRFWISTNKLLEEISRTANGTVKQPSRKKKRREKLHAALKLIDSAKIEYIKPDGEPGLFSGLIDGGLEYRHEVKCHGNLIKEAWGFIPNPSALSAFSLNEGYIYDYDQLPVQPYEEGDVWIPEYLYDLLRELRSKLYTWDKNGNSHQRKQKKAHISRSWKTIFSEADPLRGEDLRSEKKREIVEDFQRILQAIADKEAKGENHHGAVMYIKARSTRDGAKGRGKGTWATLEIEAYNTFHKVDIDLS